MGWRCETQWTMMIWIPRHCKTGGRETGGGLLPSTNK
jgi:hypothetical protein